jgi:hypothetical protein
VSYASRSTGFAVNDALGVVRNLPASATSAALDPVEVALVGHLQQDPKHARGGLADIFAPTKVSRSLVFIGRENLDVRVYFGDWAAFLMDEHLGRQLSFGSKHLIPLSVSRL